MTNKIINPWGIFYADGQAQEHVDNKDITLAHLKGTQFLAYTEPFEPIKLTQDDVGRIEAITNINNLGEWYNILSLNDDQIAFLYLHRGNWHDFVEMPEKKYYLISKDAEAIGNNDKYLNVDMAGEEAPYFYSENETGDWKTQFTQTEIDELGDRIKNLRKEAVK